MSPVKMSNVLLHLKYKVFLCYPNIEFIILAGGKALTTDHRGGTRSNQNVPGKSVYAIEA